MAGCGVTGPLDLWLAFTHAENSFTSMPEGRRRRRPRVANPGVCPVCEAVPDSVVAGVAAPGSVVAGVPPRRRRVSKRQLRRQLETLQSTIDNLTLVDGAEQQQR
eukprot:2148290-Rhodomonas_salina.1